MSELLNSLTSDNLVLLCVIMGVVALFLAIAISIEIINNNKRYQKLLKEEKEEDIDEEVSVTAPLNIKTDPNVKYIDENSELEKTKAKLELAALREKLKKEEEEKNKLLEMNLALSRKKDEKASNDSDTALEKTIERDKHKIKEEIKKEEIKTNINIENVSNEASETVNNEVAKQVSTSEAINRDEKLDETLKKLRVATIKEVEEKTKEQKEKEESIRAQKDKTVQNDIELLDENNYVDEDEAIISYDELKNATSFGYSDQEMDNYVDEKDAIISIQELEKLYNESLNIEVEEEKPKIEFEMKRVEDLPKISEEKIFQSTPFISPVFGKQNETDLVLEQTANLEKLNEEIKKTNEFLKTLKDLKKNLE